jgi:hypothetical protein
MGKRKTNSLSCGSVHSVLTSSTIRHRNERQRPINPVGKRRDDGAKVTMMEKVMKRLNPRSHGVENLIMKKIYKVIIFCFYLLFEQSTNNTHLDQPVQSDQKDNAAAIWKKPIQVDQDKTTDEQLDSYFADLLQ